MIKKSLAAFVAVTMVWLSGCAAGGGMYGPPRGYLSPNAAVRVTARNQNLTRELLGLGFPGFYDPSYYQYGFNNPYLYGEYDWAWGSGRWHYRRHRSRELWTAIGSGALGFVLGRVTAPKPKQPEEPAQAVPEQLPAEAPATPGCYSLLVINLSSVPIFFGDPLGEGFTVKPRQSVQDCLLPGSRPYKLAGNTLVQVAFVRQGDAIIIR